MTRPEIVGHRGAPARAPENTLASFRRAVGAGVDWIEMDVQRTRDGRLVIMHDGDVRRTTNGTGRIGDMTLAEVKRLDAGSWFSPAFEGERVPTFEEVLCATRDAVSYVVEIKEPAGAIEGQVLDALRKAGWLDRCAIVCGDAAVLREVRKIEPSVIVSLVGADTNLIEGALAIGARWISVRKDACTSELAAAAHAAGLRVGVWVINDPADLPACIAMGVDRVTSNDPERIVQWLSGVFLPIGRPADRQKTLGKNVE